jgi:hypothetical protein
MDKKYKINWCEVKRTGTTNGRAWSITEMTLVDEQGNETTNVSTFDSVAPGTELEGQVVKNAKGYLNFIKKEEVQSNRKPNMDRIIEKKQQGIAESQERKERGIAQAQDRSAWMWAKTNASTILANRSGFASQSINEIADQVLELATMIYNGEPTVPFN